MLQFSLNVTVVASSAFEKGSVLFSIAAMQTQLAESQSLLTDEGLKTAARLFQVCSRQSRCSACNKNVNNVLSFDVPLPFTHKLLLKNKF